MENRTIKQLSQALIMAFALLPVTQAFAAFVSGSTGADGAFNPTVNTVVTLPPDGIFNYTTVNIPVGVTVTFRKIVTNTPLVMLATGNVTVAGTLQLSGTNSTNVGAAGDGNLGDEGQPGVGGPGGYDGGAGVIEFNRIAGAGLGPGGGGAGTSGFQSCFGIGNTALGGGGGGFSGVGASSFNDPNCQLNNIGGAAYGSNALLPLIGGSGGGGGGAGVTFAGSGGGGGGGAILIASSGTVNVTGAILANGGSSGASAGAGQGATGGGGSGGGIRVLATTITGNGTISAIGGTGTAQGGGTNNRGGGNGASGRIRLEGETISRTAATNPAFTQSTPSVAFVSGLPALRISTVAGVAAPASPTGSADITLPATTTNPVVVTMATSGVPVGNIIRLTVTPRFGATSSVVTPAITGTTAAGTASASVTLPGGPSVLSATVTYTIVASLGADLSRFAKGEQVESIRLSASTAGPSEITLITITGKEYTMPAQIPALPS